MPASNQSPATSLSISASFAGTLVAVKHLSPGARTRRALQEFRIGSAPDADAAVLQAPSPEFALVTQLVTQPQGCFALQFEEHWQGWVSASQRLWTLQELIADGRATRTSQSGSWTFPIPENCTIQIQLGTFDFWIRPTHPERTLPRRPMPSASDPLLRCLIATAAVFLSAVFALPALTVEEKTLDEQAFVQAARIAHSSKQALEKTMAQSEQPLRPAYASTATLPPTRERKLLRQKPGSSDDSQTAPTDASASALAREKSVRRARHSGIVGLLSAGLGGRASAKFDAYVRSIKFDSSDENIERYGDLAPRDLDKASGAWGHGIRKIGPGSNDGKDWSTIESGPYAMSSAGLQRSIAEYEANALTRPHPTKPPKVASGVETVINSGLKYDVIRGQLGLRQRRLRRCFELDEVSDPTRPNPLLLAFHISPDGEVGAPKANGVNDGIARSCIEGVLLSIRFPSPSDGKAIQIDDFPLRI